MYQTDSDSKDSDEGIRFKTESIRNKKEKSSSKPRYRDRSRSPPRPRKRSKRDRRSPSREKYRKRNESRPKQKDERSKKEPRDEKIETPTAVGPALPPHLLENNSKPEESPRKNEEIVSPSIGPQLPPHLREKLQDESVANTQSCANEESDEDTYGPVPAGELKYSKSQIALEERALELKISKLEPQGDKPKAREEWMLELPEVKASRFGLGPRQFKAKAGPDFSDRSSWTETPDKKGKGKVEKVDLKKETEIKEIRRRNEEQEKISKKHKVKNKDSLLEMHQNKLKKNKKEEKGPTERRPFNRETDLQVNRFDEAQKKAVLKKAQLLDDRFSSGHSKFL